MRCKNAASKIAFKSVRFIRNSGPTEAEYPDYNDRLAALVRYVEAETMLGHKPGGQYDAVLIDEAHDFEPEWLSLAVKMVNPNTKAFLIAYDDMQAIYKGMGRPVWPARHRGQRTNARSQDQLPEYGADSGVGATSGGRGCGRAGRRGE